MVHQCCPYQLKINFIVCHLYPADLACCLQTCSFHLPFPGRVCTICHYNQCCISRLIPSEQPQHKSLSASLSKNVIQTSITLINCNLSLAHELSLCTLCVCNIFSLLWFSFQKEEIYLNLVLDFVPETVYRVARHYSKAKQTIPILYIKVRLLKGQFVILLATLLTSLYILIVFLSTLNVFSHSTN